MDRYLYRARISWHRRHVYYEKQQDLGRSLQKNGRVLQVNDIKGQANYKADMVSFFHREICSGGFRKFYKGIDTNVFRVVYLNIAVIFWNACGHITVISIKINSLKI